LYYMQMPEERQQKNPAVQAEKTISFAAYALR
jgi:hypothetical protein